MSGYRSFVHAKILTEIAKEKRHKDDFEALADIEDVEFDHVDYELLPRVLVGHDSGGAVWARLSSLSNETDDYFKFHLLPSNGNIHPNHYCSDLTLCGPFANLASCTTNEFQAVVVFFLVELGCLEKLTVSPAFIRDFLKACAQISRGPSFSRSSTSPSTTRASTKELTADTEADVSVDPTSLDSLDTIDASEASKSQLKHESDTESQNHDLRPSKRQREDDDFADYQALVQRISRKVKSKNDATIASLREELTDLEVSREEEAVQSVKAGSEIAMLRSASETQQERIQELEKELQSLRNWKEEMKKMF